MGWHFDPFLTTGETALVVRTSCSSPRRGVGANLEEAKAASSKREFVRYVDIALREARESSCWLRICASLELEPGAELERLRNEGDQIARILGAIVVKTKARGV